MVRWIVAVLAGGLVAVALCSAAERVWPASRMDNEEAGNEAMFPRIIAANLEGKRYELPRDLEGDKNLLLIAFTQEQQFDVNTWLDGVKLLANTPGFEFYELPTLSTSTPAFRGWLDSVMRQGIPDKRQRERTITLYLDKKEFRKRLNLPDEQRIYALLTDRTGRILWRSEGRFDDEKGRSLGAVLTP